MRFEMFTEDVVEIFALHIIFFNLNEFFLSVCMQHTDKMYQESGCCFFFLGGGHFLALCTAGSLELPETSPLGPHHGSALDPRTHWGGGLTAAPQTSSCSRQ